MKNQLIQNRSFLNETKTKDLTIRDNIPGINDVLIQGSDNILINY